MRFWTLCIIHQQENFLASLLFLSILNLQFASYTHTNFLLVHPEPNFWPAYYMLISIYWHWMALLTLNYFGYMLGSKVKQSIFDIKAFNPQLVHHQMDSKAQIFHIARINYYLTYQLTCFALMRLFFSEDANRGLRMQTGSQEESGCIGCKLIFCWCAYDIFFILIIAINLQETGLLALL